MDWNWRIVVSLMAFAAVYFAARHGWPAFRHLLRRQRDWYDEVLNRQLLLNVPPRVALGLNGLGVLILGLATYAVFVNFYWALAGAAVGVFLPFLVVRHLEQKRRQRLELQLVDGITTLASGVRAGLTLVQSMELLQRNSAGPIQQEFGQLLREYEMGLDLNQVMRRAANRIGLTNYRLLFTALEMHRQRGGDVGQSLDRICESVREIQRLEGKLDALTAQGRTQARMMGAMPVVMIAVLYAIDPEDTGKLFTEPAGRVILLVAGLLILAGFVWIRRIMSVDI